MRERLSVHAVRDANEILLDDRALVQVRCRKVRGRADELDAVVVGLMICAVSGVMRADPYMASRRGCCVSSIGRWATDKDGSMPWWTLITLTASQTRALRICM